LDAHWLGQTIAVMLPHAKAGDTGTPRAGLAIILILDANHCVTLWFSARDTALAGFLAPQN
jgi:hypothetical protein